MHQQENKTFRFEMKINKHYSKASQKKQNFFHFHFLQLGREVSKGESEKIRLTEAHVWREIKDTKWKNF